MNQVGDIVLFTATGTLPGSATPIYVWKFWDADVEVSAVNQGTVSKRLNMGGNPAETGLVAPFTLPYRCEICNEQGTVVKTLNRMISVNNPPSLHGGPTVNPNNEAFPFSTQISVHAYDLENTAVKFYWYYGTNAIGGHDVTTGPVAVAGTYYGTLIGANRNSYSNTLTTTVTGQGTVYTCKIVDNDGGTNLVHVPVQGYDPAVPQFSVAVQPSGLTVDAATLPDATIAAGQTVHFLAYAYDPTPGNIVFTWYLYGTNGWTQPGIPFINHGVNTALSRGYRNDYIVSIANETGDGERTALLTATNVITGMTGRTEISVNMTENETPIITSVGLYDATTGAPFPAGVTKAALPARTLIKFTGTGSDPQNDATYFKWTLTTPGIPANYMLYGADCFVDVTTWPAGAYSTLGFVVLYDKYGAASADYGIPQVTINP